MAHILIVLAFADALALLVAGLTGLAGRFWSGIQGLHMMVALLAVIVTLGVHALVMLYFLGTGKSLDEATQLHGLDPRIMLATRVTKRQVFPLLMMALVVTVATGIMGGAADTGRVPTVLHGLMGLLTLVMNGWALTRELEAVSINTQLIERVKATIDTADIMDVLDRRSIDDPVTPSGDRRAQGRNLVFIGINVWVPYVYLRYLMRLNGVTFEPFLALSALGIGLGLILVLSNPVRPEHGTENKGGSCGPTST